MKKILFILVLSLCLVSFAQAVAIDDSINPQNCERSDATCAKFMDTTSLGQVKWGGLIAGGLRSLSNLFVDGKLGVGTLRPSTGEQALKVDVEGAVGAKFFCDENGNNCVAGSDLGGGGNSVNINIDGNGGIIVNRTNNTFNLSVSTSTLQMRITGVCPVGQAIRSVGQDGSVVCQDASGSGTGDSLWSASSQVANGIYNKLLGKVGVGTENPLAKLHIVASDNNVITAETTGQFAYLNLKDKNGVAEISNDGGVLVLGGQAVKPIVFRNSGYTTRMIINQNGLVGIGKDNPSAMLDIKQTSLADALNGQPSIVFSNPENKVHGEFGRYSAGAILTSDYAGGVGVAGFVTNGGRNTEFKNSPSTAIMGMASAPDAYAARFISYQGVYTRGDRFALYATNEPGAEEAPSSFLDEVRSGKSFTAYFVDTFNRINSFAAYFKGKIAINDGTQGAGKILTSDPSGTASWCRVCIRTYDTDSNAFSAWQCTKGTGDAGASDLTGFDHSTSIEKVQIKMQCN